MMTATEVRTAPYMVLKAEKAIQQPTLTMTEGYIKAVKVEIYARGDERYGVIYYSDGSDHAIALPEEFHPSGWMDENQAVAEFAAWVKH